MMRRFANLFLILFLADGAISVLDELFTAVSGMHLLIQPRDFLAFLVLFLSGPVFVAMGLDRRLPKRVFLPMAGYALWGGLLFWPMPLYIPKGAFGLIMALGQLGIGLAGIWAIRKQSDHAFLLSPSMIQGPWFSLKNTLACMSAGILIIPVLLCLMGFSAFSSYVEAKTNGFMRITTTGLYMNEKTYGKDGKTLRLIPMIHIGRTAYYREIGTSMTNGRTLILAEGVSDEKGLLKTQFSYDNMGELLGLDSQSRMQLNATYVSTDFEPLDPSDAGAGKPHIVSADIDLSEVSPATVAFINTLATALSETDSPAEAWRQYTTWIDSQVNDENALSDITYDIFTRRNEAAVAMMTKALPRYDTLIVPWGALHMAFIEKKAQRLGFILLTENQRLSVSFREALEHLRQVQETTPPAAR
ncbi:hypothetical protein [Desulfoluna spongiiphila]|uniref:Uncharacterized protein n=1 Tax=Desulfoluna spongiiphila TaxID=419481 RepID=A0A1G5F566_9BACT|nr:hypothetical protein [Desulfoluna spongiiphila]SCY33768.1 hypothetical protein SAMN05216233_107113 [Desulfoluna spongiiphila]